MGRKKEFPVRITLPLADEMAERIDQALTKDEVRLDLIREAIERELKRRARKA
jgi:metal-responsive CopG/Arc/MetJ family transcriptional regulator